MAWIDLGSNPIANAVGVTIVIILLIVFIWYFHKKAPSEEDLPQPQSLKITRFPIGLFRKVEGMGRWL